MITEKFISKQYEELNNAIWYLSGDEIGIRKGLGEDAKKFFDKAKEMSVDEFMAEYNDRFGDILDSYYNRKRLNSLNIVKGAAILFIITTIVGVIMGVIFLATGVF